MPRRNDHHTEDGGAATIPFRTGHGPEPVVYYASKAEAGGITEHRVFAEDPRPACALCAQCKAHLEGDGRYYCDRQAKSAGVASPLPWCSA